jgi:hypothetical protein
VNERVMKLRVHNIMEMLVHEHLFASEELTNPGDGGGGVT